MPRRESPAPDFRLESRQHHTHDEAEYEPQPHAIAPTDAGRCSRALPLSCSYRTKRSRPTSVTYWARSRAATKSRISETPTGRISCSSWSTAPTKPASGETQDRACSTVFAPQNRAGAAVPLLEGPRHPSGCTTFSTDAPRAQRFLTPAAPCYDPPRVWQTHVLGRMVVLGAGR